MLHCKDFYESLNKNGICFFTGVPDSLLKSICAYITDKTDKKSNIITANEGNAIALAAGYYLSTGKTGAVYMQNSGLGNASNPLISLVDPDVYNIPLLLIIGWRGEPGKADEPQHVKQGKVTLGLLEVLGIPYEVLPDTPEEAAASIDRSVATMNETSAPYALVVRKGTFEPYALQNGSITSYDLSREEAIKLIVDHLGPADIVISTTGKASRELFEYRRDLQQGHRNDFLTVGSMGHSSSIALGIALSKPERNVYCLDGDGASIMHMGAKAIIGHCGPGNFKHIVINNGSHDSVGGQPTAGFDINFSLVAKACGYRNVWQADKKDEIIEALLLMKSSAGPCLLEIKVNKGSRKNLGRPTVTPKENKRAILDELKG